MSSFAINTLTLDGNLVADPELRTLASGNTVCNLRIAHNEQRKDANGEYTEHASFYDVTVWAGPGEWVAANLVKSDRIVISGRLSYREYEVDGKKRSQISITAESIIPVKRTTTTTPAAAATTPEPAKATRARARK